MRFEEGCRVYMVESYVRSGKSVHILVRNLVQISKRIPVYIVLHPTVVTIGFKGLKRSVAIATGSAVMCEDVEVEGVNYVELAEPTWIDVGLLVPYLRGDAPRTVRSLDVEIRSDLGVHSVVLTQGDDQGKLVNVIDGGLAFIVDGEEVEGSVVALPRMNKLFLMLKTLNIGGVCRARVARMDLDPRLKYFEEDLVAIGGSVAVSGFGKGYLVRFEPIDETSLNLLAATVFTGLVVPVNSPVARAHLSMLVH